MKYIKVLEPIVLKNLFDKDIVQTDEGGKKFASSMSFKNFLLQRVGDQKLSADMESLETVVRLKKAIDSADTHVELETSDWKALLEVVKNPSSPYNPLFAYCLLPFMKAVEQASDEKQ